MTAAAVLAEEQQQPEQANTEQTQAESATTTPSAKTPSHVKALNNNNFDDVVNQLGANQLLFIKFYAPW